VAILSPAPSSNVPSWRSIISIDVPMTRADSNTSMPAAMAFEAKVELPPLCGGRGRA
jgi:hypothetical protein